MSYNFDHVNFDKNASFEGEFGEYKKQVLLDYWLCVMSREASLMARKEVLTGKAKFGIVGDGKELPQVAMSKVMRQGDWRAGYYRDQTLMFALGISSIEDFFAQLYADTENDTFSGGRQMNSHYATPTIDKNGNWKDLTQGVNVSSDISCTAGQMGRSLGFALASKLFKSNKNFEAYNYFTKNGQEISFCTIGDASTSEGAFWETMNAACVMKVPLICVVWDDGYGISVPVELQTAKASISKAMKGFEIDDKGNGMYIYTAKAWDYQELCAVFEKAEISVRKTSLPALIHVKEVTQPQGHSTSGSHERYKSKERLDWERKHDCILKMAEWIISNGLATEQQIENINLNAKEFVKKGKASAWEAYNKPIKELAGKIEAQFADLKDKLDIKPFLEEYQSIINPNFSELVQILRKMRIELRALNINHSSLDQLIEECMEKAKHTYSTHLFAEGSKASINISPIKAIVDDQCELVNGFQILNRYFDVILSKNARVVAFGEDVGKIGDVNQGFAGLQEKYGEERVFDAGIREWTIIGQAIGLAMRGFRPIAEIQYLDYLAYAFSPLTDDLATLRYRSNGIQKAPVIIRTRGHRLEGIWHAGSPMGMIINSMKGIHLCVPRNMVQAAGMYNTLLEGDDPAIVVECLNGYRLKEAIPHNIGEYRIPLGQVEILRNGTDVTLVTYGSCVREALKAVDLLNKLNISVELIDVQTLMPFDLENIISASVKKTNRVVFLDEDVPGGATAYMMREVIEVQGAYFHLDAKPICISGKEHRTPFGSDGDYFTKPVAEDVVEEILKLMEV